MALKVDVRQGNIVEFEADAVLATINSTGMWNGAIDKALQQKAGTVFHGQAQANLPLTDGGLLLTNPNAGQKLPFGKVLFVVDDLIRPLRHIVGMSLRKAEDLNIRRLVMPTFRRGSVKGVYKEDPLAELALGIHIFEWAPYKNLEELTVVCHNDRAAANRLRELLFLA